MGYKLQKDQRRCFKSKIYTSIYFLKKREKVLLDVFPGPLCCFLAQVCLKKLIVKAPTIYSLLEEKFMDLTFYKSKSIT